MSQSPAHVPPPTLVGAGCEPRIEFGVAEAPTAVTVHIAGEASIGQAGTLAARLLGLSARRPSLVILDLSGLCRISALAMGALVAFRRGILRTGGRVRLAPNLQDPVREALGRAELLAPFGLPEAAPARDSRGIPESPFLAQEQRR
jgi:anti-anti-sigma regulatory factor